MSGNKTIKKGAAEPLSAKGLEAKELFNLVINHIKQHLGDCRTAIMLTDHISGDFTIAAHHGISDDFAGSYRKSPNWSLGRVLWEEIPTIFRGENPMCREYTEIQLESDFVSAICAPIICDNITLGYIHCEHDSQHFDENALRFVSALAKLCSDCSDLKEQLLEYETI